MGVKFDQQETKHQLFHLSISLATLILCMTYMQINKNWGNLGKLRKNLILPIVLSGELLKVVLARYYSRQENESLMPKRLKNAKYYLAGFIIQATCTVLYAVICIILGAPVLQSYEETLILSFILTFKTVSPIVFLLGSGNSLQVCFCVRADQLTKSEETALSLFKRNAAGAMFGAWAGSVVAPLDWDQEWQTYPIPNILGCLLGCALSSIYACSRVLYFTGKMYLSKKKSKYTKKL